MRGNDQIKIINAKFRVHIGINEKEKSAPQDLFLDIVLFTDTRVSATTDTIESTIDYRQVFAQIKHLLESKSHDLIETVAEVTAQHVLQHFPAQKVFVEVRKPGGLPGLADYTAVAITRKANES